VDSELLEHGEIVTPITEWSYSLARREGMIPVVVLSAQEAYRLGLVNEVVPQGELMTTAERWAHEILKCSPLATQAVKQIAVTLWELPMETALSRVENLEAVQRLRHSEDYLEGSRAFAEKRKPVWSAGRG